MGVELLNGSFIAELIKGKNGKKSWKYTPQLLPFKNKEVEGSMKEQPQYPIQNEIELNASKGFQKILRKETLEIVSFLKGLVNAE